MPNTLTHKTVIVGGGAAGVFMAYRLREMYGSKYDVMLLEASDRIGGNTYSTTLQYGGKPYNIDCGAQFFYKNPQASYTALLDQLGILDDPKQVISAPAGFTIWDKQAHARRLWLPSRVEGFIHYHADDWDRLAQFGLFLAYAAFLDRDSGNWIKSVEDWLASLPLITDDFKEHVIKPFLYQFVSLPLSRIGEASARYAITYFVRNVFGEPNVPDGDVDPPQLSSTPTFKTYQSLIGLDGILRKVLQKANVTTRLSCPVTSVKRSGNVKLVQTAIGPIEADHVIFACDPHAAAKILKAGGTADPALIDTLEKMEYAGLPISMQKDGACWMPEDNDYWEPVNTLVDGNKITFTAWFGKLRPRYGNNQLLPVFKSWAAPDIQGATCPHQFLAHRHYILYPTSKFVALRQVLRTWQGKHSIWFTGGWSTWFDSQEAALDSATAVAEALPGQPDTHTGRFRMVPVDSASVERNVRRWLERVGRAAPEEKRGPIVRALDDVADHG